ncbi:MAG: inositol monophosphatase family protein [Chloroflexota bacterium]
MDYTPMLVTAMRAARAAGQMARAALGKPEYQQWKGQRDILVGSVLPIQQRIVDTIRHAFPTDAILAEEGEDKPSPDADPLWIVDPLDGSLNFYQGIPHFAVSIAYRESNIYRVGVVYDPNTDEMFHAIGPGTTRPYARLNDDPITVQQISEGEAAYDAAIVGTDLPGNLRERLQNLNMTTLMATQCVTVNMMGSPALGLCYVACGRYHAYYHTALQLWDVAAASVILGESGGILTDILGGSWRHSNGGYIATNGVIHGWMLRNAQAVLVHRQR